MMFQVPRILGAALAGALLIAAGGASFRTSHAQAPDGTAVALTGARIFDGTGLAPLAQSTLVIRDGRIEAVGAVPVPDDAVRIDLSGKTIIPGLINAHGHLDDGQPDLPIRERLIGQLRLYADYGVTTVVALGVGANDFEDAVKLGDEQESGALEHARVYVAGPSLRDLNSADEARASVDRYADAGADIVKIHVTGGPDDMTPAVYGALIDQAHARGLRVAAHLYFLRDARGLVDAGVDVIAHSVRDQDVDAALIAEINRRNVGYVPTLMRDLALFVYETTPAFFSDPFFLRGVDAYRREMTLLSDPVRQQQIRAGSEQQAIKESLEQGKRNLKTLSDAGVLIALGTDSGTNEGRWQGFFEHTELEMMVEAGMSPAQALVAATGGAAQAVGLDQQIGTLQPGLWADLLVLNDNPLDDIRATRQIHSVWIAGRRLADVP